MDVHGEQAGSAVADIRVGLDVTGRAYGRQPWRPATATDCGSHPAKRPPFAGVRLVSVRVEHRAWPMVGPAAPRTGVARLCRSPWPAGGAVCGSCGPGRCRRPPIRLYPAFGQELLGVAVRQAKPQIPAHRQHDRLGREPVIRERRRTRLDLTAGLVTLRLDSLAAEERSIKATELLIQKCMAVVARTSTSGTTHAPAGILRPAAIRDAYQRAGLVGSL